MLCMMVPASRCLSLTFYVKGAVRCMQQQFTPKLEAVKMALWALIVATAVCGAAVESKPTIEALHEHMTEDELGYFLGTQNRLNLPDYEVVLLPHRIQALADNQRRDSDEVTRDDFEANQAALRDIWQADESAQDTQRTASFETGGKNAWNDVNVNNSWTNQPEAEAETYPYGFRVFGKQISLQLRRNNHLISPYFRTIVRDKRGDRLLEDDPEQCHYLHQDTSILAAISSCLPHRVRGIVVMDDLLLEILPLNPRLRSLIYGNAEPLLSEDVSAHIVRRHIPGTFPFFGQDELIRPIPSPVVVQEETNEIEPSWNFRGGAMSRLVVEVALFLDQPAYRLFAPFLNYDENQMRDLMLAYLNGVQALYHHPSLGRAVDIILVRLEMFYSQPSDLPHHEGDRGPLLESFCVYNERHNPRGDDNPLHWDMGLYVSGLDFFAYENGRKSGVTMGLATVGGVCIDRYACVIAELGTVNVFGKPYPSAGFTSVYILAHEIGHNLGMHHDSTTNSCPKEGFIMSPSRGTQGETTWSTCSREIIMNSRSTCLLDRAPSPPPERDHETRYRDEPGQKWGAKRQCAVLLRDRDAELRYPNRLQDICDNLQCRTPHRSGFYFAGPALTGTSCSYGKWCQGGQCVPVERKRPVKVVKGGWSSWRSEPCRSGCLGKSRGFQSRWRKCDNPKPVNTEEGCEGPSADSVLCDDGNVCRNGRRQTAVEYASKKCREFSKLVSNLDPVGAGLQAPHEEDRLWMGCAIFCRRSDSGSYYTPRIDLNDMGVNAYFPDGTWCHQQGSTSYYCQQRHCLPEGTPLLKSGLPPPQTGDVPHPQNALPSGSLPPVIQRYLGVNPDGTPLLRVLPPEMTPPPDDAWLDRDYFEIPNTGNAL